MIEFLTVEKSSRRHHRHMQAANVDKHVDVSTFRHWVRQFKQEIVGEATSCGKARVGRPGSTTNKSHRECIEEMISIEGGGDYVEK